jgi:hypothetical protein
MKAYMRSDSDEPAVRRHLDVCPSCRAEVEAMETVLAAVAEPIEQKAPGWLEERIMLRVALERREEPAQPLNFKWAATGIAIFAAMVVLPFGDYALWGREQFGSRFDLPLHLVLGGALAVYSMIFVFTHMGAIAKALGLRKEGASWHWALPWKR